MIVQIQHSTESLRELCLLEFQGELVGQQTGNLGTLTLKGNDTVEMVIGNHFLEGSFQNLKSPLLIVDDRVQSLSGDFEVTHSNGTELHVQGIVRRKIIFKNRPKPAGKRTREQAEMN